MFKTNAELWWEEHSAQDVSHANKIHAIGWLNTAKQRLQYLSPTNFLNNLIYRQLCRTRAIEKNIKDTFFYSHSINRDSLEHPGYFGRRKVLTKTWKRYSALLVYRQQVNRQQVILSQIKTDLLANQAVISSASLANNEPSSTNKRLSYRVKSIRNLPVWATAYGEMGLIENDVSALRSMDFQKCTDITAEAA